MVKEPHAWILGLPLNESQASPLTVWERSHDILRAALLRALEPHAPETWGEIDLTEALPDCPQAGLRHLPPDRASGKRPGEATLIHRLTLHGVAAWKPGDQAPPEGRMIAYLRPQFADVETWLKRP